MSEEPNDDLLERLGRLETGLVSDVLDEAGLPYHALASAIVPLAPGDRCAGRALCVRGEPRVRGEHAQEEGSVAAIERAVRPGSVVVITTGGVAAGACVGGFVAYSLQRLGCRGVVTDGAVRDAAEIRELGLPTFCRAVTPVNGSRRWRIAEVGGALSLTGDAGVPVTLCTGDYVLADADGVVVIPGTAARSVIEDSERLAEIERRIGEELRGGDSREAVFKRNPRFAHVRRVAGVAQ